jgi:hypothetical protein
MFSLTGAVQTCSVNTGWANKLWSDRYENPDNTLCPVWNGLDTFGRIVAFDSFYTKAPGCQSAEDRVVVENQQRPRYFEFVTLDAQGFQNPAVFSGKIPSTESYKKQETLSRVLSNKRMEGQNGSTSTQLSGVINQNAPGTCGANGGTCPPMPTNFTPTRENYVDTRARQNFEHRRANSAIAGYRSACNACQSGNN